MTLPDFSAVFSSFQPQTGYQGPGGTGGTGPGSHAPQPDLAFLTGELGLSSGGLPVSQPEAFTQRRPQRDVSVSVSDTASTATSLSADTDGVPSSPPNNAINANHNNANTQVVTSLQLQWLPLTTSSVTTSSRL